MLITKSVHLISVQSWTYLLNQRLKCFPGHQHKATPTYFKAIKTFRYTHRTFVSPLGVEKGFIKGEFIRVLRSNSFEKFCMNRKL